MNPEAAALVTFHLTGDRSGGDLDGIDQLDLRPALLTGYGELTDLRYDYPLILVDGDADGEFVRSLSRVVDRALQEVAPPGNEGECLRQYALRIEREIRCLVSGDATGSLSELWDLAESNVASRTDNVSPETPSDGLDRVRSALGADGEVIDCDDATPARLLTHAWAVVHKRKARRFLAEVDGLILKLRDILRADAMRSDEARTPDKLKGSVGTVYEAIFDFEEMSRILTRALSGDPLPEKRRRRVLSALSVLESQRFFAPAAEGENDSAGEGPHAFVFDSCAGALAAFRDRLPEIVALIKAMSVAELEIENRYSESTHDSDFGRFDESALSPEDLDLFPSYLVRLRNGHREAPQKAELIEALSSGLPVKVLVQTDDVLDDASAGDFSFGVSSLQLAGMALGLNSGFVLQSSSSNLYQQRDGVLNGVTYAGPALFSIFSGSAGETVGLPPYLSAAAAMQSRAFPTFTYDPSAGPDWASRFRIDDNPQPGDDWPAERYSYEGEDLQRRSANVAFTFIDLVACDRRYARHFARVARSAWHDCMVPVADYLERASDGAPGTVPYVLMVDGDNVLHRVVVANRLIHAARRCGEMWRSLQELGGINNSHARRLLDREREAWERERAPEAEAPPPPPPREAEQEAAVAQAGEPLSDVAEAEDAAAGEPYIETPRCTTCNECTELNGRMFAYDDNMQAYIADRDAGTYRELVESAEICQVSIIRPGKPRDPNEPNLDELIKRAEPFNSPLESLDRF